jgi:cell division transport system ATP-binding protein
MIRVFKLWKQYGDAPPVLMDLSLHVDRGEFVFLTGPSGSGKTTLLKILIGEEEASAGQVVIAGTDMASISERQVAQMRRNLGFVFQDFKLLPDKTAFDNVALVLKISGLTPGEQRLRAIRALRRVGLEHRMHYYPEMLSGGEQQRTAIARAVVADPELLLADEPTGNLDPDLSLEIMEAFREINARGTTVVVATHDKSLIAAVGRRVINLVPARTPRPWEAPSAAGDPSPAAPGGGGNLR